jgi:hypothetical protein
MMETSARGGVRPMNVIVAHGSRSEKSYRDWATALAPPEQIAPGLAPTPAHDLIYHGGKTIPNLTFTNFYVGGQQAWQAVDIQSIDAALAAAMSDRDLNNVMMQYFSGQAVTSTSKPSQVLPGAAPPVLDKTGIEGVVSGLHTNGEVANFDLASTVFNLLLPSGIVLSDKTSAGSKAPHGHPRHRHQTVSLQEEADSLHGLGGYHGSVHVSDASGAAVTVYYAAGVYSEQQPNGTVNGIPVFDKPWKNVVATLYHELNEARTDADVEDAINSGNQSAVGWVSQFGEECGDFPIFEANPLTQVFQEVPLSDGSGTVPVQFMYSNAVHGPEGPISNPH